MHIGAANAANACSISPNARPDRPVRTGFFVLTTRAAHWFRERGFIEADRSILPGERQALYNLQRRSRVLVRAL